MHKKAAGGEKRASPPSNSWPDRLSSHGVLLLFRRLRRRGAARVGVLWLPKQASDNPLG
jgi:hypothetical protein